MLPRRMPERPPFDRPEELLLHESEVRNGRCFRVEVRPGKMEGQYLGIMIRCWGFGHIVARGEAHHYTMRDQAIGAGQRWLEEGRR